MTAQTAADDAPTPNVAEARAASRGRLMRLATYASVAVAVTLIAIKIVAWWATGSLAVLSTLADSSLDLAASAINLMAVRHALEPADHEHRFGHGKAEPLAGLGQSALVFGSALFLLFEAASRLFDPQPVTGSVLGIGIIAISIALTLALVLFQKFVVSRTGSIAIAADHLHYKSDLLMNAGVIASLILAGPLAFYVADPIITIAIALYLGHSAWEILGQSMNQLMDREMAEEERERIKSIATSHAQVHEIHDLRTRLSGSWAFIQFHVEMDPHMSLMQAHKISDEVEAMLQAAYPDAEIFIHQDPLGHEDLTALEQA